MSKHIVVAEDERAIAHALTLKFEKAGHTVTHVMSGSDALAAVKKGGVDMLVLDLMMPGGDGFSVLDGIRDSKVETPVVVTSNLGQTEDQQKVMEYPGVKKYFVKSDTPISDIVSYVNGELS